MKIFNPSLKREKKTIINPSLNGEELEKISSQKIFSYQLSVSALQFLVKNKI